PRGVEPRPDDVAPVLARGHLPVPEELGETTGGEHLTDVRHELADDGVPRRPAVAVLVLGHARGARGDDERRVGHDEVEALARPGPAATPRPRGSWASPRGGSPSPPCVRGAGTPGAPGAPRSRYSYSGTPAARGVMTNGGLDTTGSKRRPATGGSIEP